MSEKRRYLQFESPFSAAVRGEKLPGVEAGEILVDAECSAVSAGTELLLFRGEAPEGIALDETLPSLEGELSYPLRYGYAFVGRVSKIGAGVDHALLGRRVFLFHPHATHAVVPAHTATLISEELPPERAVFLPNLETAVNLLLDGAPLIGEEVVVFGLGVVGTLTTILLSRMLRGGVIGVEPQEYRRSLAMSLVPDARCVPPEELVLPRMSRPSGEYAAMQRRYPGFDLVYELSGRPETLNHAVECAGFGGRVVVGSWYGRKSAPINLGGRYHRARLKLISSQVSTVGAEHSGRWSPNRRLNTALRLLHDLPLERLVTHEVAFQDAPEAYERLAAGEPGLMQLIFRYTGG
ncbi:MAG: zinc-dependent alcohol dehydrogenase [Spirochaetaceae bacterium]